MLIVIALLLATAANAEPLLPSPPQPQPKIGAVCPSGYQSPGGYCRNNLIKHLQARLPRTHGLDA